MRRQDRTPAIGGLLAVLTLFALNACAPHVRAPDTADAMPVSFEQLRPFRDHAEFQGYVDGVEQARRRQWAEATLTDSAPDRYTSTRASERDVTQTMSIEKHQAAGVEGGDIVKTSGRFLVILSEGRLFTVDTGDSVGRLALVDRVNVYLHRDSDVWYDELLLHDDVIVVTGYNYDEHATELALFQLDADGGLSRLITHYLRSDDDFSGPNHAARLVDDRLVLYLSKRFFRDAAAGDRTADLFPAMAQRLPTQLRDDWSPLLEPADIATPVQGTLDPILHTILTCSLSAPLQCTTQSLTGPAAQHVFVTTEGAYLWLPDEPDRNGTAGTDVCTATSARTKPVPDAAVYRLSFTGDQPRALYAAGKPIDQSSFNAREHGLDVLVQTATCDVQPDANAFDLPLQLVRIETGDLAPKPRQLPTERYVDLPDTGVHLFNSRFSESHLFYSNVAFGPLVVDGGWSDGDNQTTLVAVSLQNGASDIRKFNIDFAVRRLERLGNDFLIIGDHDGRALHVGTVVTGPVARVSATAFVTGRIEAARRSQAFSYQDTNEGQLFGLPVATVRRTAGENIDVEGRANIAFFVAAESYALAEAGVLESDKLTEPALECHLSCLDWYGSASPVFLGGRIFALAGLEVIEGEFRHGTVTEAARLRLDGETSQTNSPREVQRVTSMTDGSGGAGHL